jgi:ornithine cyclodeaminase/alanine dehydrogenase-like protein (mu-crystallin family)
MWHITQKMLGDPDSAPPLSSTQPDPTGTSGVPEFVCAEQVRSLLSVQQAADALERGFLEREAQELDGVARTVLSVPDREPGDESEMLLMPAFGPEGAGLKLVSITRGNQQRGLAMIQGLYVLLSPDSMTPQLVIDGAALTALRTSAVSALATRRLARADSRRLVVFGAGAQGRAHVSAMRAVLPIEQVTVVGTSPNSARVVELVAALQDDGLEAGAGDASAVSGADVVCCCTTSRVPLFANAQLPPGVHVNAVGSYRLDMAEVPAASLARALLVVESLEATLSEAGDVVAAIKEGALPAEGFAHPLSAVLRGEVARQDASQITIFKSVGLANEDLILARALADAL